MGLIVRVVLCSVSACVSFVEVEKVDGWACGVVSIVAMILEVLLSTPAVIIFRGGPPGREGPTTPCCASKADGSSL